MQSLIISIICIAPVAAYNNFTPFQLLVCVSLLHIALMVDSILRRLEK